MTGWWTLHLQVSNTPLKTESFTFRLQENNEKPSIFLIHKINKTLLFSRDLVFGSRGLPKNEASRWDFKHKPEELVRLCDVMR